MSAVVLGAITGIGGGVLRDILLREVPVVLRTGLYAIPALVGAAVLVIARRSDIDSDVMTVAAAATCFVIRLVGIHFDVEIPKPRGATAVSSGAVDPPAHTGE